MVLTTFPEHEKGRLQEETFQIPFASIMEKREIWRFVLEHEKEKAFLRRWMKKKKKV